MMRNHHPDSATLALHAGGDLGWFQAWRTARHVARCGACRDEIAACQGMREMLPGLSDAPDIPWDRLAREMRANIRLGLAAGECVRETDMAAPRVPLLNGFRAAFVAGAALVLLVTGIVLERPTPSIMSANVPVVQPTGGGVERRAGDHAFALMHEGVNTNRVTYSVSAQGTMGASYVDPQTNLVTMTKVYVE
ncbi:MAG: hypothetical protein JST11_07580 [Acidobacteria bacterium]|nr:hypothetical protein [Acidobacteriota bacterium]